MAKKISDINVSDTKGADIKYRIIEYHQKGKVAKITEKNKCSNCGFPAKEDNNFCNECGYTFVEL